MAFELKTERFSGPLHLLLELIEGEELPITEVSLAAVADDFLRHIDENEVPAEELADFLVIATKLLLLKSKAILPTLGIEGEEDATLLALQLRMYKAFVDASRHLEERYGASFMFAREKPFIAKASAFAPPSGGPEELRAAFEGLLKRLEPFFALARESMERVVSVQERIGEIRDAILERSRMTFREVVKGAKSRVDVVVSFLALLELMKRRIVRASQDGTFSDITITHAD